MRRIVTFVLIITSRLFISLVPLSPTTDIYQSYITVRGEGPLGQYMSGWDSITMEGFDNPDGSTLTFIYYERDDAVRLAKEEIQELLSGLVYGYRFQYRVHNKMNNSEGWFELEPVARFNDITKFVDINQFEEGERSLRFQAIYRLSRDQKSYLRGYQSSLALTGQGMSTGSWVDHWPGRMEQYRESIKLAILHAAKRRYKARPLDISGRLLLAEPPLFGVVGGQWRVSVKIHLIIQDVTWEDVY
jgi:hypothetical protein